VPRDHALGREGECDTAGHAMMPSVGTGIACVTASVLFLCAGLQGVVLALWPAVTFGWLGVAYLLNRPTFLGKKADGSYRIVVYCVLLPYLWLAVAIDWMRRRGRRPRVVHVHGNVFFGGRADAEAIPQAVTHIVDLAAELPKAEMVRPLTYESFPILDQARCSTSDLVKLVRRITTCEGVYIHCAAGRSRSTLIAACILLHHHAVFSASEAVDVIVQREPRAILNRRQRRAVDDFYRAVTECR